MAQGANSYSIVLHDIKEATEEAKTAGGQGSGSSTGTGADTAAKVNNPPNAVADNSAIKLAALELKVRLLEKQVEGKVGKAGPIPTPTPTPALTTNPTASKEEPVFGTNNNTVIPLDNFVQTPYDRKRKALEQTWGRPSSSPEVNPTTRTLPGPGPVAAQNTNQLFSQTSPSANRGGGQGRGGRGRGCNYGRG
jgi:hypothetical protein